MPRLIRVLMVEDDPNDAEMVLHALRRGGFEPEWHCVDTELEYLTQLHAGPDVILSDHALPEFDGSRALQLLKESGLEVPFITVSGTIGEDVAVEAMRHGVSDYLLKNNLTRLGSAVSRVLEESRLRKERRQLEEHFRQAQKLEAVGQLAGAWPTISTIFSPSSKVTPRFWNKAKWKMGSAPERLPLPSSERPA